MIAVEVTKGTSLTDYNVGVAFTKELPLKENQRDEVLRYNEELIKKYGLDVTIVVLSDPLDPSALEEEYIIASIISNRETCPDICRRLGCSYDRIRLKVRRQKSNPIKVIKRSSGRPSIVELQAPALGADPRSTIRWTNSKFDKILGNMGGDASNGAMFGEVTPGSMIRICSHLGSFYDMRGKRFFDFGAGANKPATTVAAMFPMMKSATGGEYMDQRTSLASKVLQVILEDESSESKAHALAPINVVTVDGMHFTNIKGLGIHVFYAFNSAFDPPLMYKIAEVVNSSDIEVLIMFSPLEELKEYLFEGLIHKGLLRVQMSHSGEGKTVHFYLREKKTVVTATPCVVPSYPALLVPSPTTTRALRKRKEVDSSTTLTQTHEDDHDQHHKETAPASKSGRSRLESMKHSSCTASSIPSASAPHPLGHPESEILRAMELCEDAGSRKELIDYLKSTFESGLKTSEQVLLPDGHIVKKGIREKKAPEFYGF